MMSKLVQFMHLVQIDLQKWHHWALFNLPFVHTKQTINTTQKKCVLANVFRFVRHNKSDNCVNVTLRLVSLVARDQ